MLKQSITYTNFADETITEDFYFHLTRVDLIRLEAEVPGGISEAFNRIINNRGSVDGKLIMDTFEKFILASYGIKSADGRKHRKNPEILEDFVACGAYDAFFSVIVTDAETAANFITAIMPQGLIEEAEEMIKRGDVPDDVAKKFGDSLKAKNEPIRDIGGVMAALTPTIMSRATLMELNQEEFREATLKIGTGEIVIEG